ncbi:hypothetical protein CRUP_035177, partial [Coryphaenoides rupestris]
DHCAPGVRVRDVRQRPEQCVCGGRGRPEDQSLLRGGRGVPPQLQDISGLQDHEFRMRFPEAPALLYQIRLGDEKLQVLRQSNAKVHNIVQFLYTIEK